MSAPTTTRAARIYVIFAREFRAYFATPLAAVFLVIFLFLAGLFTFNIGSLYERNQADLRPFFQFVPWLFLLILPAISMRLWAEERRTGTIELLVTLPFALADLVVGKFLAAWAFATVAIALTLPLWGTLAWLGDPDHGTLCTGYLATILLAGFMLSVGSLISAWTKNQVIAFVLSVALLFIITHIPATPCCPQLSSLFCSDVKHGGISARECRITGHHEIRVMIGEVFF